MHVQFESFRARYFCWLVHPLKIRWARFVAGFLLLMNLSAAAGDLVVAREHLMDPTGQLTAADVSNANFMASPEFVTRGYTDEVMWLRVRVTTPPENPTGPVMLRVRPTILDSVQLWTPDAQSNTGWRMQASGDLYPFLSSDRSYGALGFIVFPESAGRNYLIRIATTSTMLVHVEALPLAESNRKDARWVLLHLLNLTLVGGILVWSLYAWRVERLALAGWFAAYQFSNIAYVLLVMGFVSVLEPFNSPGVVDTVTGVTVILTHLLGLWLDRQLLGAYGARSWALHALSALIVLVGLALAGFALGWHRWALQINMSLVLVTAVLTPLIAFSLHRRPPLLPDLSLLRVLSLVLLLTLTLTILPLLGGGPAAEWSLHTNLLHGLLASGVMSVILWQHVRLRRFERQRQQTEMQRLQAQVRAERQVASDHRQFIDMLTHEIKTPLGIALISMGALKSESPYIGRIGRALKDINTVIDRTRLSDLAEHQRLQPVWDSCALRELLYECTESSVAPERLKVFAGEVLDVRTDSGLLSIVINNLLDNALKYSPPESPVEVRLHARTDGVWLTVINALGPAGAPDEHRLFSKYYRAPAAQAKSGSGLGLYLSRQLAHLLGVQLHFQQHVGRVEFGLCLPV